MNSEDRLDRNKSRLTHKLFIYNPIRVYLQRKIEAPRVLAGFSLPSGAACIEIGCGHGAGTLLISRHFDCGRIVGVDNDPEVIERARSFVAHPPAWARGTRTDKIEFACADAARLPYADRSFDAAFLFAVLNSADAWKEVVSEIYRVLELHGVFSFKEAIRPATLFFPRRLSLFLPVITEVELKEHLTRTGFHIERFVLNRRQQAFVLARKESE
jgi:ubiquinone/menaquinone biosynthesis C-methylase UbiE